MANKKVMEETFGNNPTSPSVSGGTMPVFGHMVKDGQPIPSRGTSVNSKTGFPVKGGK